ncbi:hypothetical protein ACFRJ9_00245 [Paenarthrobacter sp. NPDC056912]|uniref:hypothetical protein n=1 Tax=Paenarthrobacter sp. NPDC056912 TaxID=3345965 RepID=UPI003670831E
MRRSWRVPQRHYGRGVLLAALTVLSVGIAPANAAAQDGPAGWLELDAGPAGEVHRLTPGDHADWAVSVDVPGEVATSLAVTLGSEPQPVGAAAGSASENLADFLSVGLRACDQPWVGSTCGQGERTLLTPVAVNLVEDQWISMMEPGTSWSAGTYVLVSASLAEDAPREIQGSRMNLWVGVHGSGDEGGGGETGLANSGFRLGGAVVLGVLAVGAGFGLARLRGAGT